MHWMYAFEDTRIFLSIIGDETITWIYVSLKINNPDFYQDDLITSPWCTVFAALYWLYVITVLSLFYLVFPIPVSDFYVHYSIYDNCECELK